jgi:hypothetical protein
MPTEHHHKNKLAITFSLIGLILAALVVIFLTKSYPVVLVGHDLISAHEWSKNYDVAKKLDSTATKNQIFDQLVINVKKQQLAGKVDMSSELDYFKAGRLDEYNKFLNDYFSGDEKLFIKFVVAPRAYDAMLAKKYNSDFSKNNNAYNKAENILEKLNQGTAFEELAKTYSDDKVSGQLGGDLGFVSDGQILPELQKVLETAPVGEVKKQIVISRLGYHILYPVETSNKDGVKVWHVKHILITTSGYDNWLKDKLDNIGVHQLMSI